MARFTAKKISSLIDKAQVATDNATNQTDIAQAMALVNYPASKIQEGQGLLSALKGENEAWLQAQAKQKEATATFKAQWSSVGKVYNRQIKLARALLDLHPELLPRLGLEGGRAKSYAGLLAQMRQFYTEAQADSVVAGLLAGGGLTVALLQANQAGVETAVALNSDQENAKSRAQAATVARDAAATEMEAWLKLFWLAAKLALNNDKQRLEALGQQA